MPTDRRDVTGESREVLDSFRCGDQAAFVGVVERYRGELRVHCYRLLGSVQDSEDLVQETFVRAWQARGGFQGRSTVRAWLYRIATNACLDVVAHRRRRSLPYQLSGPSDPETALPARPEPVWLQPCPDRLLESASEPVAPREHGPEAVALSRETVELAFIAALQTLPARQRAAHVLRDVVGWSAAEVAEALDTTVAAVNSALQRARATVRAQLGGPRGRWSRPEVPPGEEREVLERFMDAVERGDTAAIAELVLVDVRGAMPPYPMWYSGRESLVATLARGFALVGGFRTVATRANRAPAVALYHRARGASPTTPWDATAISVLRIVPGGIAEITSFHDPGLFGRFALPDALPAA